MKFLSLILASVAASHFDNLDEIRGLKFDHVMFKTKKDCALDNYPDMRQFLEKESAHYPELDVRVASDGQSRFELFNEGKKIDIYSIPVDDKKTFELLRKVETVGVFQLESQGMKSLIGQMEMREFEELISLQVT